MQGRAVPSGKCGGRYLSDADERYKRTRCDGCRKLLRPFKTCASRVEFASAPTLGNVGFPRMARAEAKVG